MDLKLATQTRYWTILSVIALIGTSLMLYTAYVWVADMFETFLVYKTALELFTSLHFYSIVILNAGVIFVFDIIYMYIKARYYTSLVSYMRAVIKRGNANVLASFNFLGSLRPAQIRQYQDDDQRAILEDMSGATTMKRDQPNHQQIELSMVKSSRREEIDVGSYLKTPPDVEASGEANGSSGSLPPKIRRDS